MEEVRELGERVSNWGRWGRDDERGALNLIGPQQVIRAARLIQRGVVISLAIELSSDGPVPVTLAGRPVDRRNPVHLMTELGNTARERGDYRYSDDWVTMPLHSGTHWDALSHVVLDGTIYNGFAAAEHITPTGATRCSIDAARTGVIGRGVLLDVARYRGVDSLAAEEVLLPNELDEVASAQNVALEAGDIVLIRTGWWEKYLRDGSREQFWTTEPGPGLASAEWFSHHDFAAVGSDNFSVEAVHRLNDGWVSPDLPDQAFALHVILTRYLGMLVGELFDLRELADDCEKDGRYEFFFCAPPLRVQGGIGSPVNPVAIK